MGCWNGTCQLSNLPITEGTPVYLMLTVPNPYIKETGISAGVTCYSTDLFEPVFLPIKGEYNDYGSITVEDNLLNSSMFNFFDELIHTDKIKVQDDRYYKPKDLEGFITCVERGLVTMKNTLMTAIKGYSDVGFVMVREDVLKHTLGKLPKETEYSFYLSYDADKEKENYMNFFKEYIECEDMYKKYHIQTEGNGCIKLITRTSYLSNTLQSFLLYNLLDTHNSIGIVEQAFDNYITLYGTIELMDEFRKSFAPLSGGGSQSYSKYYENFFEVCRNIAKKDNGYA